MATETEVEKSYLEICGDLYRLDVTQLSIVFDKLKISGKTEGKTKYALIKEINHYLDGNWADGLDDDGLSVLLELSDTISQLLNPVKVAGNNIPKGASSGNDSEKENDHTSDTKDVEVTDPDPTVAMLLKD